VRLRVFDGMPLGTTKAVDAVQELTSDRFRAVLDVLMTVTVQRVGKPLDDAVTIAITGAGRRRASCSLHRCPVVRWRLDHLAGAVSPECCYFVVVLCERFGC